MAVIRESKTIAVESDGCTGSCEIDADNLKDLWELSASVDGYAAYRSVNLGKHIETMP